MAGSHRGSKHLTKWQWVIDIFPPLRALGERVSWATTPRQRPSFPALPPGPNSRTALGCASAECCEGSVLSSEKPSPALRPSCLTSTNEEGFAGCSLKSKSRLERFASRICSGDLTPPPSRLASSSPPPCPLWPLLGVHRPPESPFPHLCLWGFPFFLSGG